MKSTREGIGKLCLCYEKIYMVFFRKWDGRWRLEGVFIVFWEGVWVKV